MSGKKVLIVYAHQEPKSMSGSLKNIAVEVLQKQGCNIVISDLYAMNFKATATRNDITGELCNPQHFNYGVEAMEAYKKGCLCEDILGEQKKVQDADLVIFQFPLYWFSFPAIMKGWIDRIFVQGFAFDFPDFYDKGFFKHGIMHFCGFKVLAPQVSYAPEYGTAEKKRGMLESWAQRLENIWNEKPIECTPPWYFD